MKNVHATASPRAPQGKILPFPPRGKRASTSPWAVNAPAARDPIYDSPSYRVMSAILDGYDEKFDEWWNVTVNGRLICHSRGREGWSSRNKYDAYWTVCAVARMMGYGELICEEFVLIVDQNVDHNLPSRAEMDERAAS